MFCFFFGAMAEIIRKRPDLSPGTLYHGWIVVAVAMLIGLLTGGLHAYSRGIFLKPIAEELGANRTELSIGFTITTIVAALISPTAGYLLDRISLRKIIIVCAIWTGLGYFALALIQSRLHLFLALGLFMGTATFTVGGLALPKIVLAWFQKRRGLALSLVAMGASLGGVIAPPITTFLIELFGWRQAFYCFSAITFALVVPLGLYIKTHPEEIGLSIGNEPGPTPLREVVEGHDERSWRRTEFLGHPAFWAIALIFGTMTGLFQGVSIHLFPHMTDIGISVEKTAIALSLMAAFAMLSKPVFGWMVDHASPLLSVTVSLLSQVSAMLLLLLSHHYIVILFAISFFGFGYGGMNPLRNGLLAMVFGRKSFGEIAGLLRTAMLPLGIVGMPLAGWIFDTYQSYDRAFIAFAILYLVCLIGLLPLRRLHD
jgi:MFS family permease